ncbi:glycosyltransferase [Brachybacterium sp. AOP3-A1-3]|uniref:glycosyltransferase n=1 Tax=Brachybacterium sp. AOP3-A1-3 TaxID=3457699 RepID=UPI004033BF14
MNIPVARGELKTTSIVSSAQRALRNGRLLATAALQHLVDDPALLAIQVSRRLPFTPRMAVGRALEQAGAIVPAVGALGSVIVGRDAHAEQAVERANVHSGRQMSRLAGEVAILLDRVDLIPSTAPAATRARAAWSRGGISEALDVLERDGQRDSRYARRLRSELQLLQPGFRLSTPTPAQESTPTERRDGEPLRVLHLLTNSLPHTQSGYSLRSHRILTALRDQGIESIALTRTGYPVMVGIPTAHDEDIVDGIRYVRTLSARLPRTQKERLEVEVHRALQLVDEFRPHLVHVTTNYLNALVAQEISTRTGLPWVLEVRGLMEKTWVASHRSEEGRAVTSRSERRRLIVARESELARDADAVVTLSKTMADELAERGVDRESITLVPNGVDDSLFEDHVSIGRAREIIGLHNTPNFGQDALLIGAVSALVDYEGFDVLLRAAARLMEDEQVPADLRSRLRIVIAGEGVSRPGLDALAEELGIQDRVLLPGRIERGEARRWVEALDLIVIPRLDMEVTRTVTPQKPVEAMALGRPLIVSDLPALREAVSPPGGPPVAVCVPPGDPEALAEAIEKWAAPHYPVPREGADGLAVARSRSWGELVRRYSGLYERVAGQRNGGRGGGE